MALCANIYRRGGVYWWRRRPRFGSGLRSCHVQISLGVRDPDFARRLGRLVGVEADRIASLMRRKMLGPAQQRDLLKRFIKEQVAALDQVAIKNTTKPVDEDGPLYDVVFSHSRMERLLSAVFDILAAGGVGAQLQDHDRVRLGAEGLGAKDIQEIADLVAEFAPAYATFGEGVATEGRTTVGPDYQLFSGVLREMGIAISEHNPMSLLSLFL